MILFSFKYSLIVSVLVHIIIFVIYWSLATSLAPSDIINIPIQSGSSSSIRFRIKTKGISNLESNIAINDSIGSEAIQKEIYRIQKSIPYPESALQRNLESDCEWLVTVAENGIPEKVETTRKCRYEIFESTFKKIVTQWKFQLPQGTKIRIPISFRIVDQNE